MERKREREKNDLVFSVRARVYVRACVCVRVCVCVCMTANMRVCMCVGVTALMVVRCWGSFPSCVGGAMLALASRQKVSGPFFEGGGVNIFSGQAGLAR